MKNPHMRAAVAAFVALLSAPTLHAADIDWMGDVNGDFQNGANWESDPAMPNPATDIHRFKSTTGPTTITNASVSLAGTGTTPGTNQGQILFENTAPAYLLQGGTISLPAGTFNNAIVLGSGSTFTQTIASNIVVGNGATSSGSIVNHSTTGGLLKVTGNITGGTGAGTPGAIAFSFGNAATQNGNYQVTGNITKGATATGVGITKRGSGILTLSGTNDVTSLGQNEAGSSIVINGGKTSILQGGVQANWGGSQVTSLVKVTGGELYANDAYQIRSKIEVDGGTLTIGSALTESGFSWGSHASLTGELFTLKNGTVDFASSKNGGYNRGFQLFTSIAGQTVSGNQTGGNFLVNGRSAAGQVFTLGKSTVTGATTAYSISGGLLDLKGLSGTTGFLQINSDAAGTSTTTFTLSGTGKLISRFNPSSGGGITGGANTGAKQIFTLEGGTLVAGRIDAANLRGSEVGTNGTIVNNGSKLSPGDDGSTGKTTLSGNLSISSGTLAIDIGGTSVSTAWQDVAGSGKFDQLAVTGSVTLGGELAVRVAGGFIPERDHSFAVVTGASISGGFSNVQWGTRMLTADGLASFIPSLENNSVILRYFDWQGAAPHITRHPVSLTMLTGKSATFDIELLGKPPFSYQWYKNNTAISGATLPWLTLGSVSSADAGSYHVVITNTAGSVTSTAATLAVNASSTALDRILYAMNQTPVTGTGAILDAVGLTSGTMTGSPLPQSISGASPSTGDAWDFSNSASYLQVPTNSFLNKLGDIHQTTGITVSGWLKLDYQTDGSTPDSNAFSMGTVLKANNTAAKLNFTFGSAPVLSTGNSELDGNWHHYAATFDFQKQSNNLVLYVDGVAVITRTYPVTASFAVSGLSLGIGASNTGSYPWPGQIDEFSIHSRALVASEVVSLYNSNTITAVAPQVVVGADSRTIQWPAQSSTTLRAVVTPTVSGTWSKTSGPTATIANTGSASTNVTFSGPGTYIFRHTVTSGGATNFGEVLINVIENQAPVITQSQASPTQLGVATVDRRVTLKARATDDALPNPPGMLTSTWTQLSGPATVTVTYPELWETPATIPAVAGTYVMQFSVTDGAATTNSTVSIVVADSLPPVVTVDADAHTLVWNGSATTTLRGSVSDDGRPLAPSTLTGTWTQVSGPAASFATPVTTAANTGSLTADTQVTLPSIGQYVFRFTGSDGGASTDATTWITVWAPGAITVNAGASRVAWLPDATLPLEGSHSANPAATVQWSSVHGPAPVVFSSPAALNTQATFSAAGKYRVQLNVSEGSYIGQDSLVVEVYDASQNFGYTSTEQQVFKEDPKLNYIHEHAQWSRLAPPPPPYVHPRLLFNPDDLPDLRQRLSSTTTSGQLAMANIRTSAALVTVPTNAWRPAYDALAAGDATVFNALSSTDRSGMAGSIKNECFRALIDDDAAASAKAGAALAGLADSIYQTIFPMMTPPATDWRAFLQGPCYGDTLGWGYDFAYNQMTEAQRTSVRRTLALMTNEVWNVGLDGLPGFNANISNWIPLTGQTLVFNTLAIEGEEGSDPDLALRYMALYDRMCDSFAFPDGALFEGMGKGWIGLETYFALAKRGHKGIFSEMARNHLRKFYIHCMEPYGYGFNWDEVNGGSNTASNSALGFRDVQVAKFLFPADPLVDFVYRNACGTNYNAKFTNGGLLEAICAENITNPSHTWSQALAAQVVPSTPLSQFFNKRGLFTTRSEWSADALKLQFQPRSAPGGHPNPDRNGFSLSGLGRTWVRWYTYASGSGYVPGDPSMATSVVRVDNKGSSTVPATVVDFHDSASFSYSVGDASDPYGKAFGGNVAPTDFSFNDKLLIKSPLDWADLSWADLPDWYNSEKVTVHGTRSIRNTRAVQRAFRSAALVRGGVKPYSIIVDDIQMDQDVHNYKWRIMLDSDLTQVTVNGNDAIVTAPGSSTSMLVRLLSSSAPATFRTDNTDPWIVWPWLDIEVNAVAPDFKVLLLPFENGTPLPTTTWRGQVLDVAWAGGQTDHLLFAAGADGRTRLSFSRGAADTVGPVLTLPSDISITATGADGAVVTFTATATDDVDGSLPVTCSPPSGSTFPIGTTTVQCSAHDTSLNGAGGIFNVTVLPGGFSLTAPVVSAQGGNQSAVLTWDAIAPASSYIVQRSTSSGSGFATVASGITGTRFEDTGLTNGTTYYYTVTAVNGAGQGPASNQASVTPAALPGGWFGSDIGAFGVAGTSVLGANGSATLTSSGTGFGSTSDSFHFTSREWSGDGSIVVRMLGFQNATNYTRGGVMFRQSTAANAAFGFVGSVYYAADYSFTSRASAGAGIVNSAGTHSSMPQWFKLTRSGSTLSAYQSLDASPGMQTWKLVGSAQVPLNSPLLAGLAHFSTATANTTTATFDHFGIYTAPTINPQADIVRAATQPDGAHVDFNVTGNSNVDGLLLASYTTDSGSLFPVGITTVTATVKDSAGQTATTSFSVTVTAPPDITGQPASLTVNQGESAQFTVTATTPGGVPNSYQWRRNGVNISSANSAVFLINSAQVSDAGAYDVVVANVVGSVVSASATLAVTVPPTITQQPVSRTVDAGTSVSFTVAATVSGEVPNVYQWRKNGVNISGAIQAAYSIAAAQSADAGSYDVVISNTAGSVTSSMATLTVNIAQGSTTQWVGDTDAQFANGANWTTDPNLPSLSADTWQINTEGNYGSTLTVDSDPLTAGNQALVFTGTAGKIAFGASAPAMTLTGGDFRFFKGTNDTILFGTGSTVTQTVQNNLVMGDGSLTTMSVTNQSITGGLLKVTGSITAGTGGTGGPNTLSFGSTGTNNGNYEVTGNISKGATATEMRITKRGSGTLTLSGTNEVKSLGQNETNSTIDIAGGKTSILQGGVQQSWGGNQVTSLVKVTGGELYANDASAIRSKLEIDGGTLTIGSALTESGLYWANHASLTGELFTLKSGTVDFASSKTGGYTRGFQFYTTIAGQTISGNQTGGTFLVAGRSAAGQVFTLGNSTAASATISYSLSGGLLDLKGQTGTLGFLQINANAAGTSTTTFTLSGTGKLISRFNPSSGGGIIGGVAGGRQVLDLQGGTLVAGRIDAANLRGSAGGSNGTIVNNGTTIAPGDVGSSGKTTVSGNLTITSGSLAFDIGGTAPSTAWKDAEGSGKFDQLAVTGNVVLGDTLNVALTDSFVPANSDSFIIITAGGGLSGAFANVSGGRVTVVGGGSFAVTITSTQVRLGDYAAAGQLIQGMTLSNETSFPESVEAGPDIDPRAALLRYALGANAASNSHASPMLGKAGDRLTLTFARLRGDVTYFVEGSSDLVNWSVIEENPGEVGGNVTVTDTVDVPNTNKSNRFLRVRVSAP